VTHIAVNPNRRELLPSLLDMQRFVALTLLDGIFGRSSMVKAAAQPEKFLIDRTEGYLDVDAK
jgi:hypothetical protein